MHREVYKYVVPLIGLQLGTDCCVKKISVQLSLHQFIKKVDEMLSATTFLQR